VIIRHLPNQAKKKFKKAESFLRKGGLVYLSIEGKRSFDGSLSPYKKGPALLAIQANAKIFPVIILGY
jgi:1-acyl-sn-glycerol-3-phosphate acyltransferase